jgi:hypothetical protein
MLLLYNLGVSVETYCTIADREFHFSDLSGIDDIRLRGREL